MIIRYDVKAKRHIFSDQSEARKIVSGLSNQSPKTRFRIADERLTGMTSEQNVILFIDQSEVCKIVSGLSNQSVKTQL